MTLRDQARGYEPDGWWLKATDLTCFGYEAIVSEIVDRLATHPAAKDARVLDWGAGPGFLSYLLESQGVDTTYYEFKDESASYAFVLGQLKGDKVFIEDPVRMPFQDGSFDAVTSCGVLEHVPDPALSLAEIHRVLRPGGLFFVHHFPNRFSWTERLADRIGQPAHDLRWTKRQMLDSLEAAGFEPESFDYRYLVPRNLQSYPRANRFITRHAKGIYDADRLAARVPVLHSICTSLNAVAVKR